MSLRMIKVLNKLGITVQLNDGKVSGIKFFNKK